MGKLAPVVYRDIQEEKEFRRGVASIGRKLPSRHLYQIFQQYEMSAYQIPEVVRFLPINAHLYPLLLQAMPHIRQIFGQCPVYLEVEKDPDEGFEELLAIATVRSTPEKALALLAQFDQEWFTKVARQTRGRLNFIVDTVKNESV